MLETTNCTCGHRDAQLPSQHHSHRPAGGSNAVSARVTASARDNGHAVTVAKGSFKSKEPLLRFALLCLRSFFFLFLKQSLQRISVKLRHDAGEGAGLVGARMVVRGGRAAGPMHLGSSRRSRRERQRRGEGGVCFDSVMRASSPRPLSAETETVAGGSRRGGAAGRAARAPAPFAAMQRRGQVQLHAGVEGRKSRRRRRRWKRKKGSQCPPPPSPRPQVPVVASMYSGSRTESPCTPYRPTR